MRVGSAVVMVGASLVKECNHLPVEGHLQVPMYLAVGVSRQSNVYLSVVNPNSVVSGTIFWIKNYLFRNRIRLK